MASPDMDDTIQVASGGGVDESGLFQCAQCARRFARMDHLSRHIRTHTKDKPYQCPTCLKHFARADLMRRHAWRHVGPEQRASGLLPPEPSLRAAKACPSCAASKSRCDDQRPCRRCQRRGIPCGGERDTSMLQTPHAPRSSVNRQLHAPPSPPSETHISDGRAASTDGPPELQSNIASASRPINGASPNSSFMLATARDHSFNFPNLADGDRYGEFPDEAGFADEFENTEQQNSVLYADFLKDLLFTSPHAMEPGMARGTRTPNLWSPEMDMSLHFGDALADIPFGDFPPLADPSPFVFDTDSQQFQAAAEQQEKLALEAGKKAFSTSVWHWIPTSSDHGTAEQDRLALPPDVVGDIDETLALSPEILSKSLRGVDRDRTLSVLLEHCDRGQIVKIVSSFPSRQLMEKLMHTALHFQTVGTISFLHVPTFDSNTVRDEMLACLVAYGSFLSPVLAFQRLGAAMADILFLVIPDRFCENNANTRDLQLLQCFALYVHILFWSGSKRRTEIGESFIQPLVTMLRRANAFASHRYSNIVPTRDDSLDETSVKWRTWVEQESRIRLVYHVFAHDAQASVTNFTNPLMTAAEMALPLPSVDTLWTARSGEEWRERYLAVPAGSSELISLSNLVRHNLEARPPLPRSNLQCNSTGDLYALYGVWHIVWTQQLFKSWLAVDGISSPLQHSLAPVIPSTLSRMLDEMPAQRCDTALSSDAKMVASSILINYLGLALHAPLMTFPAFAGKDGEGEARRVYYMLQEWSGNRESRQSIWHAGQIVRHARALPRSLIQSFFAVAIYHASLTMWTFSIIASARNKKSGQLCALNHAGVDDTKQFLRLDGDASAQEIKDFVALGGSIPVITNGNQGNAGDTVQLLGNPGAAMRLGISVLQQSDLTPRHALPRFVESLTQLMGDLSDAAQMVGFG